MIDGVPTWEEKQSLAEIEEERASYASMGKLDIWYAEKMCQALAEESRIFKDEDYRNIMKRNIDFHKRSKLFPRDKIIRMAGNSIPVKLLEGIFWLMLQTDKFLEDYKNELKYK